MKELKQIQENPLHGQAKMIGQAIQNTLDVIISSEIVIPGLKTLTRLNRVRRDQEIPLDYINKKIILAGEISGLPAIVIHFSGIKYGRDPDYFQRQYENSKLIHSGRVTDFTASKIVPALLDYDDETLTLIIEKAQRDLSYYGKGNEKEARELIARLISFLQNVWRESKKPEAIFPRYVDSFQKPEYPFLENRRVEEFLSDKTTIQLYYTQQKALKKYCQDTANTGFATGFGFGDAKLDNLVDEDEVGNIMFIDVAKPGRYHWLSHLGQIYEDAVHKYPNRPLTKNLRQQLTNLLNNQDDVNQAIRLFLLGRMNRLLIPITLRNIAFTAEIGGQIDEAYIKNQLKIIGAMMQLNSPEMSLAFASDQFDDYWRERLVSYKDTKEYQTNLISLRAEVDQSLPKEKLKKKRVFIFCGIPGSGKSAVAKILNELHPSVTLRSDWIFFKKLQEQIDDDYFKAYAYQEGLAEIYLQDGYSIIMDDNNRTRENRQAVYELTRREGAEPLFIYINIDLETAAKRLTLKGSETRSLEEKIETGRQFKAQIEKPSNEGVKIIRIDGTKPLEEIKEQLKKELVY